MRWTGSKAKARLRAAERRGDIVIYELTVYPGVTEDVCIPAVEQHSGLAESLQGFSGMLYFPAEERITTLLSDDSPILQAAREPKVVQVDESDFKVRKLERAVGAYQIVHGDICREIGYCNDVAAYQRPTERWEKSLKTELTAG